MNQEFLKQALESLDKDEIIKEILNLSEDGLLPNTGQFLNIAKNSYTAEDLLSIWNEALRKARYYGDTYTSVRILADAARLCYTRAPEDGKKTLFPVLIQGLYACAEEDGIGRYLDYEWLYTEYADKMKAEIE